MRGFEFCCKPARPGKILRLLATVDPVVGGGKRQLYYGICLFGRGWASWWIDESTSGVKYRISIFWWYLRYAVIAMRSLRCSPSFAWGMATANGDGPYLDGYSPSEMFLEEMSYWSADADA